MSTMSTPPIAYFIHMEQKRPLPRAGVRSRPIPRTMTRSLRVTCDSPSPSSINADSTSQRHSSPLACRREIELPFGLPTARNGSPSRFGIYAAGAVLVPLNTRYQGSEAGHILRASGARMLFTTSDFLGNDYLARLEGVPNLDTMEEFVLLSDRPGEKQSTLVSCRGPRSLAEQPRTRSTRWTAESALCTPTTRATSSSPPVRLANRRARC